MLPRHNCPKDRRVAIYCEGLSGTQAAGGHKADIMEAFATIKSHKQFSLGLGQAAGCVLWKKRLRPPGRGPGEGIPAWCPIREPQEGAGEEPDLGGPRAWDHCL